jgi:hypothetical protein
VSEKINPGASVRARLLNRAKADKVEFQLLWVPPTTFA